MFFNPRIEKKYRNYKKISWLLIASIVIMQSVVFIPLANAIETIELDASQFQQSEGGGSDSTGAAGTTEETGSETTGSTESTTGTGSSGTSGTDNSSAGTGGTSAGGTDAAGTASGGTSATGESTAGTTGETGFGGLVDSAWGAVTGPGTALGEALGALGLSDTPGLGTPGGMGFAAAGLAASAFGGPIGTGIAAVAAIANYACGGCIVGFINSLFEDPIPDLGFLGTFDELIDTIDEQLGLSQEELDEISGNPPGGFDEMMSGMMDELADEIDAIGEVGGSTADSVGTGVVLILLAAPAALREALVVLIMLEQTLPGRAALKDFKM